jgi:uncharacterized protein YycO
MTVETIARKPAAPALPAVATAKRPAAKDAKVAKSPAMVKDSLRTRAIGGAMPAPPKSIWYRLKVALIDFACNIDFKSAAMNRLTESEAFQARVLMRPGDVLLRRTEGTTGNFFNPSWWKHAAVYVGNGKIVEATFHGVQTITVKEFFEHGDHVTVLRPKGTDAKDRQAIARVAKAQVGKEYDFDFDFMDPSRVSCTELAMHALQLGTGKTFVDKDWMGAVTGDAFMSSDKFQLVYQKK